MAEENSATEEVAAYAQEDFAHESDFSTPLHHGVIRYVPGPSLPIPVRNTLPIKNDRPYIYVPVGFLNREANYVEKILSALDLKLPNLVITTADTKGSAEEQMEGSYAVQNAETHPIAKDWTEEHRKEVLQAKVGALLDATAESCVEVGAWLMPQSPRRRNGGAQMICEALSKTSNAIALGVLGLDELDEAEGLRQSIRSSMVPLGSPVKTVCQIDYDTNVQDGAPCPQLTHLLVFESPHEMGRFRNELLALVPDIMLAFGDISRDAMRSVFETAKDGSPVVLIKHTGTNVDSLCRMFKHVRDHMARTAAAASAAGVGGGHAAPSGAGTNAGAKMPAASPPAAGGDPSQPPKALKIPPMEGEEDDLIRLFINTWPSNFNSNSIVLADPLLLSGPSYQKRVLAAITATFDLKIGGTDTRKAKRQALDYAWSFYDVVNRHAKLRKGSSESLHIQLVTCTLVSIVLAVAYDQVYGGSGHPDDWLQMTIYVLTIVLPLYVTSLKQQSDKNNPVFRWAAFQVATARMESEIFKFRAQVGPYRALEKTERAMQKPLHHFAMKMKEIWLSIKQYLNDDGMGIPENFWEFNSPTGEDMSGGTESKTGKGSDANARGAKDEALVPQPDETTPMLGTDDRNHATKPQGVVDDDFDDEDPPETGFVDDHYSPMTAEEYIECRMKEQQRKKVEKVQHMLWRNDTVSFLIKLITIFSGATAALSLQWVVPIILGVTAALGTGQEFRKYPRRIELGNTMLVQLNELKLWWMGLSMYQRQLPHNKDRLVQNAERYIIADVASSFDSPKSEEEEE